MSLSINFVRGVSLSSAVSAATFGFTALVAKMSRSGWSRSPTAGRDWVNRGIRSSGLLYAINRNYLKEELTTIFLTFERSHHSLSVVLL